MLSNITKEELLNCASKCWVAWAFRNLVLFYESWGNFEQGVEGIHCLIIDAQLPTLYAAAVFKVSLGAGYSIKD